MALRVRVRSTRVQLRQGWRHPNVRLSDCERPIVSQRRITKTKRQRPNGHLFSSFARKTRGCRLAKWCFSSGGELSWAGVTPFFFSVQSWRFEDKLRGLRPELAVDGWIVLEYGTRGGTRGDESGNKRLKISGAESSVLK